MASISEVCFRREQPAPYICVTSRASNHRRSRCTDPSVPTAHRAAVTKEWNLPRPKKCPPDTFLNGLSIPVMIWSYEKSAPAYAGAHFSWWPVRESICVLMRVLISWICFRLQPQGLQSETNGISPDLKKHAPGMFFASRCSAGLFDSVGIVK